MFEGWNQGAFMMASIAGLSTGLGGFVVLFFGTPSASKLGHLLSFSAGVMIYISFMDLLPEAAEGIGFVKANIAFFAGMIFFAVLSKLIPEDLGGGHAHDHGHSHVDARETRSTRSKSEKNKKEEKQHKEEQELKRVGLVTALGISIHNFPEGIAVYLACLKGLDVGLPIALAIAAHNIPEGMAVASPIYHSTGSKWQAFKYSMLSGLCEPVAALAFAIFFSSYINNESIQLLLAAVAGIMVLVSLKELLPTALKYISADSAMISSAIGMLFIAVSIYYLHATGGHDHHDHSHGHSHSHAHHGHHDHVHSNDFGGHGHAHAHDHHHHHHDHAHAHHH